MTKTIEEEMTRDLPLPKLPYPINNFKEMFGEDVAIRMAQKFGGIKLNIPECKNARAVVMWNDGREVYEIAVTLGVDEKIILEWLREADRPPDWGK